jgi:acetyl-CoA acetyltransferase
MYRDGFNDPLSGLVMGQTAENLARRYEISRDEQDECALRSQQRAAAANAAGRFRDEILPIELKTKKSEATVFAHDEHVRAETTMESLRKLPPVFADNGGVTAGNSSGITDGAAAVVVINEATLKQSGAEPLARIVDYEIVGVSPEIMGIGLMIRSKVELRLNVKLQSLSSREGNTIYGDRGYLSQPRPLRGASEGLSRPPADVCS